MALYSSQNSDVPLDDAAKQIGDYENQFEHHPFPSDQIRIDAGRLIAGDREFRLDDKGMRGFVTG